MPRRSGNGRILCVGRAFSRSSFCNRHGNVPFGRTSNGGIRFPHSRPTKQQRARKPSGATSIFAHRLFTRKTRAPAGSRRRGLPGRPEQALVILDEESGGGSFLLVEGATEQIVCPIAHAAMKMVVVSLPRSARTTCRATDGTPAGAPAVLQQQLDVPIDGGLIERLHDQPPAFQNFLDAKRRSFSQNLLRWPPAAMSSASSLSPRGAPSNRRVANSFHAAPSRGLTVRRQPVFANAFAMATSRALFRREPVMRNLSAGTVFLLTLTLAYGSALARTILATTFPVYQIARVIPTHGVPDAEGPLMLPAQGRMPPRLRPHAAGHGQARTDRRPRHRASSGQSLPRFAVRTDERTPHHRRLRGLPALPLLPKPRRTTRTATAISARIPIFSPARAWPPP